MMLGNIQKKTAQAIVNIFETGRPLGDYGRVTVLQNDAGHLTYGRSQTTLASGNLALLLHAYCEADGQFADALKPFLPAFDSLDLTLDRNENVKPLLRRAGDDPIMKRIQDEFFDRVYWEPSLRSAEYIGISKPLGVTVIYDSKIHGSYYYIRKLTNNQYGEAKYIGQEEWIKAYVSVRRGWLRNHGNTLLHKTVYRMDSFNTLIVEDKWELPLPLKVRNVIITEELFSPDYESPLPVSAADVNERVLYYTEPMMTGEDVKRLQEALNLQEGEIDGIFGKKTDEAVRAFQKKQGLKIDGKVGPATWSALESII